MIEPPCTAKRATRDRQRTMEARAINWLPIASLAIAIGIAPSAIASPSLDPLTALYDGADGVTCDFFNLGARIRWHRRQGDWIDAQDVPNGAKAFAQTSIAAIDKSRKVSFDVTVLVRGWNAGTYRNAGLMLVTPKGSKSGVTIFHSREAADHHLRPTLVLVDRDGGTTRLPALADSSLDCSTVAAVGKKLVLAAGGDQSLVMQFDVPQGKSDSVMRATLELVTTDKQFGDNVLGVFRLAPPTLGNAELQPAYGIAAKYPRDSGIARDPAVLMATDFESMLWWHDWNYVGFRGNSTRIGSEGEYGFTPLAGTALMVEIPAGKNLGLDLAYKFASSVGYEPEEVYFRYYVRFGDDWRPTTDGGKLPGISSTYGKVGWGGRKADAWTGWSMRGAFNKRPENGNPLVDYISIGTYAYHADNEDFWGDQWFWTDSGVGLLQRNRWYCIEQYMKVNRVGQRDAVLRSWVDGRLAFERTGFRVREISSIKIEQVWMNVYFGGTMPAPSDLHMFIDNVVIAQEYIGPMRR